MHYHIKSPAKFDSGKPSIKVFLAGSIEMGTAIDWQTQVVNYLDDCGCKFAKDVILYNPRRTDWDSSCVQSIDDTQFKQQVDWELSHIEESDIIFFYFQGDTKSPISLLELGFVCGLGKPVVVVVEPNFWRKGNIDIMLNRYTNVVAMDTLAGGMMLLKTSLKILHDK